MSVMLKLLVSESAVTAPRTGQLRLTNAGGAPLLCVDVGIAPGIMRREQSRESRCTTIVATLLERA